MAQVVKQFSFNTDLESWAATLGGASSLTMARDTTEDATNDTNAGTGVLQARRTGKNKTDGTPYWEWGNGTLNWENLGVPAGATVTDVDLDYDWRCSEYTTGANTSSHGAAELRDGAGTTVRGTFAASATFGATSAWATRNGTALTGLSDASTTAIRLRIGAKPNTGNSTSAAVTLRIDWIVVTITYTTGPTATRGLVSFAELETPLVQTRGLVSFAEFETPLVGTRGLASWAEFEAPSTTVPTRGLISVTEFEVIDPPTPTRGHVSWLEWEAPSPATRGLVSLIELQTPNANASYTIRDGFGTQAGVCEVGTRSGRLYRLEGNWIVVYELTEDTGQWIFKETSREPRARQVIYEDIRWEG